MAFDLRSSPLYLNFYLHLTLVLMASIGSVGDKPSYPGLGDVAEQALDAERRFYRRYPNRWCYIREKYLRDAASEFFGTMMLLL